MIDVGELFTYVVLYRMLLPSGTCMYVNSDYHTVLLTNRLFQIFLREIPVRRCWKIRFWYAQLKLRNQNMAKSKPRKAHTNSSMEEPADSEPFALPNSSKLNSALQKLGDPSVLTSTEHQMGLLNAEYKWEAVIKLDIGIIDDLHATVQPLLNRNTRGLLSHKLYINVDNKRKWEPWLQVKESSLPEAGKGIFALREFRKGQMIGWYYGKKIATSNRQKKPYRFDKIDAEGGLGYPGRLGLHFMNDPTLTIVKTSRGKDRLVSKQMTDLKASLKRVNVRMHKDGLALADRQIRVGDELFAHYQYELSSADS
jgi:hypothetical protein